jgi:porin
MTRMNYFKLAALALSWAIFTGLGDPACGQTTAPDQGGVVQSFGDAVVLDSAYEPVICGGSDPANSPSGSAGSSAAAQPSGCDSIWTRPTLFGEWAGIKPALGQRGILAEADYTQFYQGVASGGNEQVFRYGGKLNLMLLGDTEKMGLWKGGKFIFHAAEWQYGQNAIADAVGLAPVNTNLLIPQPSPSFAITHLQLIQGIGENGWAATVGRYNLLDLWAAFYPDYGRGLDGFMNVASLIPINAVAPGLPPVSNVFGVLKEGEAGPEAAFLVFESQNSPTTIGLDFPNGVTMLGVLRRNMKNRKGLPGSHMLAATYSTGSYTSLNTNDWVLLPGGIVTPGQQRGSWFAGYFGEQRLWQDPCDEKRYTKLYGYAGFAERDTSPYDWTGGLTLEKFGPTAQRPGDRMGVGYFYNGLSGSLAGLAAPVADLQDVHGGEVYYNAAITRWFHLTFDLQAIQSDNQDRDAAMVLGLRGKLDF